MNSAPTGAFNCVLLSHVSFGSNTNTVDPQPRYIQWNMRLRIIERPRAARVSKSDVESLHGVRVPVCLMATLRKHAGPTDRSPSPGRSPPFPPASPFLLTVWRHLQGNWGSVSNLHANKSQPTFKKRCSGFFFLFFSYNRCVPRRSRERGENSQSSCDVLRQVLSLFPHPAITHVRVLDVAPKWFIFFPLHLLGSSEGILFVSLSLLIVSQFSVSVCYLLTFGCLFVFHVLWP